MAADHLKELAAATVELDAYAPNIPYSAFSELLHSLTRNPRRLKKPRGAAVRVGEFIAAELEPYHFLRTVFKLDQDCESSTRGHAPEPCVHDSIQRNVDHKALLAELADFLEHIAEQIPVFLAIDNLHRADDRSIASFFHLRRTLHECGILLVATYRPEAVSAMSSKYLREFLNEARLHGALGGDSSAAPINLDLSLIDERECTRVYAFVIRYLRHTLPILSATERPGFLLVRELAEYCGGNALILSELVRHLRKNNAVLLSKWGSFYDTWQLKEWAQPHHDFELPESVKELRKL